MKKRLPDLVAVFVTCKRLSFFCQYLLAVCENSVNILSEVVDCLDSGCSDFQPINLGSILLLCLKNGAEQVVCFLLTVFKRIDTIAQVIDTIVQGIDAIVQVIDTIVQVIDTIVQGIDAIAQVIDAIAQVIDAIAQVIDAIAQVIDTLFEIV